MREQGRKVGDTERMVVTVLMSDVRGYSGIAEHADPMALAGQLNAHRNLLIDSIQAHGGTHMQFTGDGVMAVFGVDADYRGEIGVILINHGDQPFTVERGMRIAQMVVAPYTRVAWKLTESLDQSTRGEGGFGSTGTETRTESRGPK